MSSASKTDLGVVNGVTVAVACTRQPWLLGVDSLVVSVGGSLGYLGEALASQFPAFGTVAARIDLASIRASRPLAVKEVGIAMGDVRFVVLASPHGDNGRADLDAVRLATHSAVLAAERAGATGVAIPLLATGVLGLDWHACAAAVLPTITLAAKSLPSGNGLRRIVLFDQTPDVVDDVEQLWNRVGDLEVPAVLAAPDLAGGVSSDLVDPTKSIAMERDRLGVGLYASMLATVITERATPTPLSIGVFGEWGSGKSFFMGLLRGRVEELAGSGPSRYCHRVVSISFNAWHYADTNLWASLGDVIFRELAEPVPGPDRQRSDLQKMLAEKVDRQAELEQVNERAESEVARLKAKVDKAGGEHVTGARDLLIAMRDSKELGARLARVWKRIGVTDEVEQGRLLSRQLQGVHSDVDALRELGRDRTGKMVLAAAGLVLGVSAAAALAVPLISWLGGAAGVVLAAVGGGLLARARNGLSELRTLSEDIRGGLDHVHEERVQAQVAETMEKLRKADADQLVAQSQLDDVVTHVGELGRRLADLNPAHRMSAFLSERTSADTYSRGLGVVSALRKDFEELVRLLADWRANPDADPTTRPIDRVVLYIDDLDRCEPRQVVQVMEAVHLMLAMDLFVVVVGVDPRWLMRALCSHYSDILDPADSGWSASRVTSEDYLEKIINIPFSLASMTGGSLRGVLRSMMETDVPPAEAPRAETASPSRTTPSGLIDPGGFTIEPGADLDTAHHPIDQAPAHPLTEHELEFIAALGGLVDTPRAAKRLFNVYRMIRATRDLSEAAWFLGDQDRPGEFQAVVVLLGIVTAAPALCATVFGAVPSPTALGGLVHRDPATTWASFVADLRPVDARSQIAGLVTNEEEALWARLHLGLQGITAKITLPDLTVFQLWAPRVRRFSYISG